MSAVARTGTLNCYDSSISIWEDGISAARASGGIAGVNTWERKFKRDVFARIIQTLNRLGWTVGPWDQAEQYKCIALNHRTCSKGDLKGQLEISGRCIKFEMWQDVTPSENRNGGRYDFNKAARMPYLLRIEMERTRRRISNYLCNVFTDYTLKPCDPKIGINGVTALEYAAHGRRTSGHYVPALDRAKIPNGGQDKSGDGYPLENGTSVYAIDRYGRVVTGVAFYSLNDNWQVVTGRYSLIHVSHKQIFVKSPGNVRVKRNDRARRTRLEGEMQKAIISMKFERAAQLRDILFPGDQQMFNVWHNDHNLFHCAGFCGYTADQSRAGKFTADEVRGWDCAPNRVVAIERELEVA